jgi:hypothetical protein
MASGFGGILAFSLQQMSGISGLSGWRWIFIVRSSHRLSFSEFI